LVSSTDVQILDVTRPPALALSVLMFHLFMLRNLTLEPGLVGSLVESFDSAVLKFTLSTGENRERIWVRDHKPAE
jgi:hypothetical protein